MTAAVLRHPRCVFAGGVLLAAIAAGALWWQLAWQNPRRVFEDMLANNLSTTSVTKVAGLDNAGQSVRQYARLEMGGTNAADWLVSASQAGSSVTTESIGTPAGGFIRYTHIALPAAAKHPQSLAGAVNVWGRSDGKTDPTLDHLFAQTLLDLSTAPLPPIGNLPAAQRANILAYIRDEKIFTPDYTNVKRAVVDGRRVYTYSVSVQLGAYVRMMQAFAHDLGLSDLDSVDPGQYATAPPVTLSVSVDRASHQLVAITYPGTAYAQSYTDWGVLTPVAIPARTITTTELQRRIQAVNGS